LVKPGWQVRVRKRTAERAVLSIRHASLVSADGQYPSARQILFIVDLEPRHIDGAQADRAEL
jgi:hypothetical protein